MPLCKGGESDPEAGRASMRGKEGCSPPSRGQEARMPPLPGWQKSGRLLALPITRGRSGGRRIRPSMDAPACAHPFASATGWAFILKKSYSCGLRSVIHDSPRPVGSCTSVCPPTLAPPCASHRNARHPCRARLIKLLTTHCAQCLRRKRSGRFFTATAFTPCCALFFRPHNTINSSFIFLLF